jgi:proline iminopeptidase
MTPDEHTNQEFFLDVGDGHQLYVQDWGDPKAKMPIVFLHGGPGGGCNDGHKQTFDPLQQRVIFFDQRGSGKSLPAGELTANNADKLVEDTNKVADHFQLASFILFGRSWGSCLGLYYTLKHPDRVSALVNGGVTLGTQSEQSLEEKGQRYAEFFPEAWENFLKNTPANAHKQPVAYHMKRIVADDLEAAKASAYAYSELILAMIRLDDRPRAQNYETFDWSGMKVEAHYKLHSCFIPENYILEHAPSLHVPVRIVQGRYDILCPPQTAYQLHQRLPDSQLLWVTAGHSGSDRAIFDSTRAILLQLTGGK